MNVTVLTGTVPLPVQLTFFDCGAIRAEVLLLVSAVSPRWEEESAGGFSLLVEVWGKQAQELSDNATPGMRLAASGRLCGNHCGIRLVADRIHLPPKPPES
jgi:single-strand DNA-binding protein